MDVLHLPATLPELIRSVGYIGIFLIVFVESGVPIGIVIPLPGDTLLFSVGLLAAAGSFDLLPIMGIVALGAVLGNSAGYWFGATFGPKLFANEKSWFMNPRTLQRTEAYFEKYGKRSLIFARFIPVLRTVVPIGAGMARMSYGSFLRYNIIGALTWTIAVTTLGFFLGNAIPQVDHYVLPILAVVIIVSSFGVLQEIRRARKEERKSV